MATEKKEASIGLWGSVVLTCNNMTGPGLLALPIIFQQAGWLPACLILVFFWISSTLSATMMCESISILRKIVASNDHIHFHASTEFSNVVRFYFGDVWYSVCQIAFAISLSSINIASIIVSAQAFDNLVIFLFGKTHALQFFPELGFVTSDVSGDDVFGTGAYVLSLGYLVVMMFFLPLGFLNLEENVKIQFVPFVMMFAIIAEFIWHFSSQTLDTAMTPIFGDNLTQLVGVCVFSYSFTTLIPSWYNEKAPAVSANKAMWISTGYVTFLYISVGVMAAWAYPDVKTDNILNVMSRPQSDVLTKLCVCLFSLGTIAPGIAVRSIMLRLNLVHHPDPEERPTRLEEVDPFDTVPTEEDYFEKGAQAETVPKKRWSFTAAGVASVMTFSEDWAMFWGVVFPWLVSFIFYEGKGFAQLINWTSLTVNGAICFLVPMFVYVKATSLKKRFVEPAARRTNIQGDQVPLMREHEDTLVPRGPAADEDSQEALPCLPSGGSLAHMLAYAMLLFITVLLLIQVGVNLFYLIFVGKNVLD